MRAAIVSTFGASECIGILNAAIPVISESNQILIRVKSSGVNPVDTYIRSGNYASLPELPYTPGKDGAGIVEKVGQGVTKFKPGDRVWFTMPNTGSAAEYALTATKVFNLPDSLTFEEGSSLGVPYMTAFRALFLRGKAKKGDKVLIHGASGGVGLAACQLAKDFGLIVAGTAGSSEGLELIKKNGADSVFNHRTKNYVAEIKSEYTEGFDLILEMASHINLATDLSLLRKNGKVAIIGCRGDISISPRMLMGPETSIFGVILGQSTPQEFEDMGATITKFISESGYKPVIKRTYELDEISKSHDDIISNTCALGNICIKI